MSKLFLILAVLLAATPARADILDAMQSVCHFNNGKQDCGSGFAYDQDDEYFYLMTAGHVAINLKETCWCYFYVEGQILPAVKGEVTDIDYAEPKDKKYEVAIIVRDLAKIRCKKSDFGAKVPKVVPLCKPDEEIKSTQGILSIGCPGPVAPLRYATMFYGRILFLTEEDFYFGPPILPGRSGSPVFTTKGDRVIGVVIWTNARAIGPLGISRHFQKVETLLENESSTEIIRKN